MRSHVVLMTIMVSLFFAAVEAVNTFSSRFSDPSNLVFLYTFQDGQYNTHAETSSSGQPGLGNIQFNTAANNVFSWSPSRQGIHFSSIQNSSSNRFAASSSSSLATAPNFPAFTSNNEATFEIWFTPDSAIPASTSDFPFWIGNVTGVTTAGACDADNRKYFSVSQCPGSNCVDAEWIKGVTATPASLSCGDAGLSVGSGPGNTGGASLSTGAPNYVAVTILGNGGLSWDAYFNNSVHKSGQTLTDLWEPTLWGDGQVYLGLGVAGAGATWSGTIQMISMWSRALTQSQIAQNAAAGVPNSVPYYAQASLNVSGLEQVDLPIQLTATDVDGDPVTYRLVTLPSAGTLYFGQGSSLTLAATNVLFDGLLTFRGDALGYGSPYSSFQYQAWDGIGNSVAITTFVTLAYASAPTPNDTSTSIRAGFFARVVLGAHNVVGSSGPLDAYITNTGNGLRVYNLDASNPNWQPGDSIALLGSEITGYDGKAPGDANKVTTRLPNTNDAFVVVVRAPTIPQGYTPTGQDVYQVFNSLRYKVADGQGVMSTVNGTVTVTVLNHLEAVFQNITGYMGAVTLNLTGRDYSSGYIVTNPSAMIFRIRTLPQYGYLNNGVMNYTTVGTSGIELSPPGNNLITYLPPPFWVGNDSVGFDVAVRGLNAAWFSAITTDVIDIQPVLLQPEVSLIQYQPAVFSIADMAYFQIGILSHSEPYFPSTDLYLLRMEINPSSYGTISVPPVQASLWNQGNDGRTWANALFGQMDGSHDSPLIAAVGTLSQLRNLVTAANFNEFNDTSGMPFIQFSSSQPGVVLTVGVSICLFTSPSQLGGACPNQADLFQTVPKAFPPTSLVFSVELVGESGSAHRAQSSLVVWMGLLAAIGMCVGHA